MKFSKALLAALLLAACVAPGSKARVMLVLSYQELLDRSDLVAIAIPANKTTDTAEAAFLTNISSQDKDGNVSKVMVTGVETMFNVAAVLKGEKGLRQFVLHHYRLASAESTLNGPMLVYFDPSDMKRRSSYLMFLTREPDGRYAPTGGQTDPAYKAISGVPMEIK